MSIQAYRLVRGAYFRMDPQTGHHVVLRQGDVFVPSDGEIVRLGNKLEPVLGVPGPAGVPSSQATPKTDLTPQKMPTIEELEEQAKRERENQERELAVGRFHEGDDEGEVQTNSISLDSLDEEMPVENTTEKEELDVLADAEHDVEPEETDEDAVVYAVHTGNGWYELPDGRKMRRTKVIELGYGVK